MEALLKNFCLLKRFGLGVFLSFVLIFGAVFPAAADSADISPAVNTYYIPLHGEIDNALCAFAKRAYAEAESAGAGVIIFGVDTYGGYLVNAIELKDLIMSSLLPTVCFVENNAISAGALLAISGEKLVMRPGAVIGAAEPRSGEEKADEKVLSMWRTQLSSAAESRGRRGDIAAAMADGSIVIEGVTEEGKLLSLGDKQALELGFIDAALNSPQDIMNEYSLPGTLIEINPTVKEMTVGWFASPFVSAILITVGLVGIILEVFTAGSGVFGIVGAFSFILYFTGHFWAGNAGWVSLAFFLVGLVLLVLEVFVIPGFGVTGGIGIISVFAAIFMASPSIQHAVVSLVIALAASFVLLFFSFKNRKLRRVWQKLILSQKQDKEGGYSSQSPGLEKWLNCRGRAITPLRPAGTALFGAERADVVTEGQFIEKGAFVEVVCVSGGRVVVRQCELPEQCASDAV
jgi:membrane-bound serine protease (ClpP class)